jgi:hypothetical protein
VALEGWKSLGMTTASTSLLSPQQLKSFHERGVLKIDLSFDPALLDAIVRKVDPHYSEAYQRGERGPDRVQDAWKFIDEVRLLAVHKNVKTALRELLGREALPFQTLNFPVGTYQKPHSDTIHFNCEPSGYMTGVWVALEDIDENDGPLIYYPGSHLLPEYSMADFNLETGHANYPKYEEHIQEIIQQHGLKPEYGLVKKGEALIWHANLLHGGAPYKAGAGSRHSQVTHYYFENCRYFTPLTSKTHRRQNRYPFWIPETEHFTLPEDRPYPVRLFWRIINKLRGS